MSGVSRIWPLPPDAELQRKLRADERNQQGLQFVRDDLRRDGGKGISQAFSGGGDKTASGASTFIGLTDVPANYTGSALKVARVNAGETALEFATVAGTGDVVGPAASVASEIALFDGVTGKLLKRATQTGALVATAGVIGTDAQLTAIAALADAAGALTNDGGGAFSYVAPIVYAPAAGTYLTATAEAGLSAEVNLGALTTGLLFGTVGGGVSTISSKAIGTDVQAWDSLLDSIAALVDAAGVLTNDGGGGLTWAAATGGGAVDIAPAAGLTIAAHNSVVCSDYYEVVNAQALDIGDDAVLDIG